MAKDVLNCRKLDDDSQRILDLCVNNIKGTQQYQISRLTLFAGVITVMCLGCYQGPEKSLVCVFIMLVTVFSLWVDLKSEGGGYKW